MVSLILALSFLFYCCSAQQLLSLSKFKGFRVHNEFNAEPPYGIYVSAQSDGDFILRQIFVISGNDSKSLADLTSTYRNLGELNPYTVLQSAYLMTTLNDDDMNKLNGVIYICSQKQLEDQYFKVYNLDFSLDYYSNNYLSKNTTVVFLNTIAETIPKRHYVISKWVQNPSAQAYLYAGIPSDSIEQENTQIFSNPMHTDQGDLYFYFVDKFSLRMTAFYVKTYKEVGFTVETGSYIIDGYSTSAVTTTGLYMKPLESNDSSATVDIMRDTRYTGSSGANVVGHLPSGGKVTVGFYDGDLKYEKSVSPNDSFIPWSIPYIAQTFKVLSTSGPAGQFFVQYFVSQGAISNTTAPPLQTTSVVTQSATKSTIQTTIKPIVSTKSTTMIPTTTNSVGDVQLIVSITILFAFWL